MSLVRESEREKLLFQVAFIRNTITYTYTHTHTHTHTQIHANKYVFLHFS